MRRFERKDRRSTTSPWAAAGGTLAAGTVALLLLASTMASAGGVAAMSFPHASWAPSSDLEQTGCTRAAESNPSFSKINGVGHWQGYATAKTCPASLGPTGATSLAEAYGGLTVAVPLKLSSGAGGVNATWNLTVQAADAAVVTNAHCPASSYSYDYNLGYTWVNDSSTYRDCYAFAEVELFVSAYVYDATNGTEVASTNYWAGAYNISGQEVDTESGHVTYSNPSYWAYNYSSSYSYNASYGTNGSISGSYAPQFFINGTFVGSDKYQLVTTVEALAYCYLYGFHKAAAAAAFDGGPGRGDHLQLSTVTVW